MYIKQVYNEKSKKYNSSGIHKTRYHNDSYLLLLGKKKQQSFEISYNFSYFQSASLFQAPHLKAIKLNTCRAPFIINTGLATLFLI